MSQYLLRRNIVDPSDKAKDTKDFKLLGRITATQIDYLSSKGYEWETIKKWTKFRASKEITKFYSNRPELLIHK